MTAESRPTCPRCGLGLVRPKRYPAGPEIVKVCGYCFSEMVRHMPRKEEVKP